MTKICGTAVGPAHFAADGALQIVVIVNGSVAAHVNVAISTPKDIVGIWVNYECSARNVRVEKQRQNGC